MSTFLLFAAADFAATCGPLTAGEPIAEIQTNLELGELSSLLRTRHLIYVESDEPDEETPTESLAADQTSGSPRPASGRGAGGEGPTEARGEELLSKFDEADLIDPNTVKLLAAENIHTVADLAAWIAGGNRPSQIKGIGAVSEAKLLAATGLTLS